VAVRCATVPYVLGRRDVVTIGGMADVAPPEPAVPETVLPKPLLLERDVELERLSALLAEASAGRGAVAVIEGPAGIGKTELLAAVRRRAGGRGFRTLQARGRELEADMAFAVVGQLLEPALMSAGPGERRRLLAGPARAGAGALGLAAGAAPASEFAALHGLYWLCVNLAERSPVLLTVDDVQWVDGPSLSWLGYFGRRVAELSVLMVVTVREGDPRVRTPAVAAVVSDPAVQRIALPPLSMQSVMTLVRRELDEAASAEFCSACWTLAGGNPLYVRELLAAAGNKGLTGSEEDVAALNSVAAAAVGASVLARLERIGPDAVALARALAVLGSQYEVGVAAELADLDPMATELAADKLAAAQILTAARPLDFFHPVIGEAVYADLALGARRLAHRRAAGILDRAGAADRVAVHLLATGPAGDPWVVERLSAAAEDAQERGAPEVAASYLRRALAEPVQAAERPALLLRLASAEWYTGQPTAIAHLEEALETACDVSMIAAASGPLANAYVVSDRTDVGVAVLRRAIDRIRPTDPLLALRLEGASALAGIVDDRTAPDALRTVDRLRARLDELPDPPVRLLVVTAQVMMRRAQSADDAERLVEQVLARKPYPPSLNVCTSIIVTLIGTEAFDTLQQLCDDMLTAARRRSAVQELIGIASFSAWALYRRGELADAEAQARWATERATGIYAIDAPAHLIEILIERDALADAQEELARLTPPLDSHSIVAVTYLMARGRLRAAQGRHTEALQDFLACGERCERLGIVLAVYPWRSEAATSNASLGRTQEGRRLARAEVAIARTFGRPRALGVALRSEGLVESGERSLALLAEAVAVLERSQAPVELARALTDHGAALRRAGQRSQARAALERGLDMAHHWGARRIAGQARAELVAAGAKPRRDAITGRDALTASELRVARLAAEGKTNREIAQSLFITTKTASAHLSRVYRKLDVSRRSQLADALLATAPERDEPARIS
jgi:DNA-binding CsgD family transcriptional regulator